jgi:flagellar biosynthesis anti-sigma factor FlgM
MSIQPTDNSRFVSLDYRSSDEQTVSASSTANAGSTTAVVTALGSVAAEETLSLTALEEQLDSASDVDWAQVNQIRQAIESGELTVDLDSLSQSILEMHQS